MKLGILAGIFAILFIIWGVSAETNLVVNGDFSDGLVGWTFKDNTKTPFGYNEVSVEEGKVRIHSHRVGNGGKGP
jgi:hypothetical protein